MNQVILICLFARVAEIGLWRARRLYQFTVGVELVRLQFAHAGIIHPAHAAKSILNDMLPISGAVLVRMDSGWAVQLAIHVRAVIGGNHFR